MGRTITATVVAAALAVAGCGEDEPTAEKPPRLPEALATALASESDKVAASLDAGDGCAARRQAQALRAHVGDAVASGEVPPELGREMSAAAGALSEGITCEPPPPAPVEAPEPPTTCEQLADQLAQLEEQMGQDEEGDFPGGDANGANDFFKELEKQGRDLEHQLRKECGIDPGDPGDEDDGGPDFGPGNSDHGGDGPGNSDRGGPGDGD